jgi:hypothetical protein
MPRRCLGVLENPLLPEEGWRKAPGWWEKPSRSPRPSRPAVRSSHHPRSVAATPPQAGGSSALTTQHSALTTGV